MPHIEPRGLVTVYRCQGRWIVARSDYSRDGMWLSADAEALGTAQPSAESLGEACLRGLGATRLVPGRTPGDRSASVPPEVRLAGVRSWRAFVEAADAVQVNLGGNEIVVTPLSRERHFYVEDLDREELLPDDVEAATLGARVLAAFGPAVS